MHSGECPGLQNRRAAGNPVTGGFDPHSLPPFSNNLRTCKSLAKSVWLAKSFSGLLSHRATRRGGGPEQTARPESGSRCRAARVNCSREILISPDPYKVVRRYHITNQDHRVTRPASRKCSSNSGRFLFALKKDSSHLCEEEPGHLTADGALVRLYTSGRFCASLNQTIRNRDKEGVKDYAYTRTTRCSSR